MDNIIHIDLVLSAHGIDCYIGGLRRYGLKGIDGDFKKYLVERRINDKKSWSLDIPKDNVKITDNNVLFID